VNYFKGQFFHCTFLDDAPLPSVTISDSTDCLDYGGFWVNTDSNFDNAGHAILALFIMSTTEGWLPITYNAIDANGIGNAPEFEHQMGWSILFMMFIVFGSFFMLNLLVGVVIDNFSIEKNL
jgi:hypothetical protein